MKKFICWTRLPHDEGDNYTCTNNHEHATYEDAENEGLSSNRDFIIEEIEI